MVWLLVRSSGALAGQAQTGFPLLVTKMGARVVAGMEVEPRGGAGVLKCWFGRMEGRWFSECALRADARWRLASE